MNTFLFIGLFPIVLDGDCRWTWYSLVQKSLTACSKQETIPADLSQTCNNQPFFSHAFKGTQGFKNESCRGSPFPARMPLPIPIME